VPDTGCSRSNSDARLQRGASLHRGQGGDELRRRAYRPLGIVLMGLRIAAATGLVVVGDLIGSGEAQERGIVGETPNLASRLQGMAAPNTVLIAESTRRLLGNLFELEEVGTSGGSKGLARPLRAWAALRVSSVASRFEALHASGLIDLVATRTAAAAVVTRKDRRRPSGAPRR
jgi:class 3 adenylate cyclase